MSSVISTPTSWNRRVADSNAGIDRIDLLANPVCNLRATLIELSDGGRHRAFDPLNLIADVESHLDAGVLEPLGRGLQRGIDGVDLSSDIVGDLHATFVEPFARRCDGALMRRLDCRTRR